MLSACLLFIYGVNGFGRPQQAARKSRFTTWRRTPSQARPHLGAETVVARPRCGRRWEQRRTRLVPDSPKGMGIGLGGWGDGREGRTCKVGRSKYRKILRVFLLNKKVRRSPGAKHCSSLCSQSEGGEYCGDQARADNPTKSCSRALVMFQSVGHVRYVFVPLTLRAK